MVTHDAFTASYASRILFLQDGAIFTELRKGNDSRSAFFEKILNVLTMIGGGQSHVSYKTMRQIGGPRGIRTLDLSDANRTLSQLSYRPIFRGVTRLGDQPTYSPFECPQLCGAQKRYACTPN